MGWGALNAIVYGTAWVAASLFFVSRLRLNPSATVDGPEHRGLSRMGAVLLWVHIFCAYWLTHAGSHQAAVEHVAERTDAILGVRSGLGIYANFVAALVWTWLAFRPKQTSFPSRLAEVFLWCMWISGAILFAQLPTTIFFSILVAFVWFANHRAAKQMRRG